MSAADQMIDRDLQPEHTVGHHRRHVHPLDRAIDEDERQALAAQRRQMTRRVVRRRQDDAVHPPLAQHFDDQDSFSSVSPVCVTTSR